MFDEKTDLYVDLTEFNVDKSKEIKRIENEISEKNFYKNDILQKMNVIGYKENASDLVKKSNSEKLSKCEKELAKLTKALEAAKIN